jgi:hypothetical protein
MTPEQIEALAKQVMDVRFRLEEELEDDDALGEIPLEWIIESCPPLGWLAARSDPDLLTVPRPIASTACKRHRRFPRESDAATACSRVRPVLKNDRAEQPGKAKIVGISRVLCYRVRIVPFGGSSWGKEAHAPDPHFRDATGPAEDLPLEG